VSDALAHGLVWVRFGDVGRQLAHLDRAATKDVFIGHKWRENSRSWVGPLRIPRFKIVGAASLEDEAVRHALKAARPGRPSCHHERHDYDAAERFMSATGDFSVKGGLL